MLKLYSTISKLLILTVGVSLALPSGGYAAEVPQVKTKQISCDTVESGSFMYYKKTTPIGKVISGLGATEISQHHRGKRYHDYSQIMLPARIARVAKGECSRNIKKVKSLLGDDMIGYFELGFKLNTPLKRKAFSSDPNYQWFVNEFNVVRNQIKDQVFFISIPIDSEYDIDSGSFEIKLPYYSDNNYRGAVDMLNQLADDIYFAQGTVGLDKSRFTLSVDENEAVKIEGQGCSLVIMGRFSPELQSFKIRQYNIDNAIIFNPIAYYVVRDSDGQIITSINLQSDDVPVGDVNIDDEYQDGEGDLVTEWDMMSVDPEDYEYVYEGLVGNDPILLCYLRNTEAPQGFEVIGFYKNKRTDEVFYLNGVRTNTGKFRIFIEKEDDCVGEFSFDTTPDRSLHGTLQYRPYGEISKVNLRLKKTSVKE